MSTLIHLQDACKRFGDLHVLDEASLTLTDLNKVGFIGRNGSGKTTVCRVLMGEEELDTGEVKRFPDLRLGYLKQHDPFLAGESALDYLIRDSGKPDWKCGEVAGRFEIKGPALENPVLDLSGGWQTRVKLAALLLHEPNLLVLDEPTNFLDLRTQILLDHFLRDFRGGALIVSHDRAFLESTCTHTVELSRGKLAHFSGGVDAFLEHKRKLRAHDERANVAIQAKRKQLQRFIDKHRAKAKTATQAKSKKKQLDRLELRELEAAESTARVRVPGVEVRHEKCPALRIEDLAIGYPGVEVASGIEFELEHGGRTVVVGDNGQGKSTLLRTVAGALPPRVGVLRWGYGIDRGYYAQQVYTELPAKGTVFDYLEMHTSIGTPPQAVHDVAGSFLFRGDDVEKPVAVLSGGERARLCLAGLLLGGHNVLILDEPGNHLDVETVEVLAEALLHYRGTVLFTSHDRTFMERVATQVLEVKDGRIGNYPGGYDAYLYHIEQEVEEGDRVRKKSAPLKVKAESREERKARARMRYQRMREATTLERRMNRLEETRSALRERIRNASDPDEAVRLDGEVAAVTKELAEVEERWLEIQETLEREDGE